MKLLTPVWMWKSKNEHLSKIYEKISLKAVKKTTDDKSLVKIAAEASSYVVREAALQAITNPSLFVDVAKNHSFTDEIRLAAAKRIENQVDIYFVLRAFNKESYLLKEIMRLLIDEKLLTKIVCDPSQKFQQALALRQITSQSLLEYIFEHNKDSTLSPYVVEKLTNQSILAEIVETHRSQDVRKIAVKKIINQASLAHIVQTNSLNEIRFIALRKISEESQNLLADIAQTNTLEYIRKDAVKKLTNPTVLASVAKNDLSSMVRYAAIEKLTDEACLRCIAQEDAEDTNRALAVGKLTDQTLLGHILQADSSANVRSVAALRINDNQYFKLRCKENVHDWAPMEGCKKVCTQCGVQAYNHSYAQIGSRFSGRSDEEIYTTEYCCSKCGHRGETQTGAGVWVDDYDTREEGVLSE